jgi:hypothetical protein
VHFGEEHFNDDDGSTLFPKVVQESGRYRPELVTTSGDKDNDGTVEQLSSWKQIMNVYDQLAVPYLGGVGNHDRTSPPGVPPGTAGLLCAAAGVRFAPCAERPACSPPAGRCAWHGTGA